MGDRRVGPAHLERGWPDEQRIMGIMECDVPAARDHEHDGAAASPEKWPRRPCSSATGSSASLPMIESLRQHSDDAIALWPCGDEQQHERSRPSPGVEHAAPLTDVRFSNSNFSPGPFPSRPVR